MSTILVYAFVVAPFLFLHCGACAAYAAMIEAAAEPSLCDASYHYCRWMGTPMLALARRLA